MCGIGQIFVWLLGGILAIVFGHIATRQIKQSGGTQQGLGLARAGLVLGYLGLVLTILGGIALAVLIFGFSDDILRADMRDQGRDFVAVAEEIALANGTAELRDPEILSQAYAGVLLRDEYEHDMYLPGGRSIVSATVGDWEGAGWRIELEGEVLRTTYVCAEIPELVGDRVVVTDGRCE